MTMIRDFVPEDWPYIYARTRAVICYDTCGLVAFDEETGKLYGAVIFDQMSPNAAQCHLVITNPIRAIRARLMQAAADYIFNQLKKSVIYGFIPASNDRSLNIARQSGFKQVVNLRDAFERGVDVVVCEMRREDCRWLTLTNRPVQLDLFKRAG